MSKTSRAQARKKAQSKGPRYVAVVGIIAVIAVAVAASKLLSPASRAEPANVAVAASPAAPANAAAPGKKLLFFMNPYGSPCQTQDGILAGVADSLSKVAELVYYKTTESADMQKFEAFGIRGLPTLVIVDRDGRELSRFSPGIQSGDAVLAALTR